MFSPLYSDVFPIHIDTILIMSLPIVYSKTYDVFLSLKVVLIWAKSVNPDEMQHNSALHLGLLSLPKYPCKGFQYTKGLRLCP